ncbi:hypothetical protein MHB71_04775 [Paenibacillus sp. FSL H7-0940]|uniref:hypothetical protein n=1 Tax=Paenibacillus sp. FSL H7-0940 TaxID=2921443 RepID=UPI0030EDF9FF
MEDAAKAQRDLTEIHAELTRRHYEGCDEVPITIAIQIVKAAANLAEQLAKERAHNAVVNDTLDRALGKLGNAQRLMSEEWGR